MARKIGAVRRKKRLINWQDVLLFIGSICGVSACFFLAAREATLVDWTRLGKVRPLYDDIIYNIHVSYLVVWILGIIICLRIALNFYRHLFERPQRLAHLRYLKKEQDRERSA